MGAYEESNMSEAARRAYEAARRAFSDAPSVPAHGWRGTLEARTASDAAAASYSTKSGVVKAPESSEVPAESDASWVAEDLPTAATATPAMSPALAAQPRAATSTPSGTLRERIDAARAKQAATASGVPAAASSPFARAENEDDDGYDPWSDRREEPSFWEEDPWR